MIDNKVFEKDEVLKKALSEEEQSILKLELASSIERLNKLQKYLRKISSL